jgi:hypothetical protein
MTTSERISYVEKNHGQMKLSEIAAHLGTTTGKAAFIKMQIDVAAGTVKPITGRTPKEIVNRTVAARKRADEYSSWGWLSARTGISEPKLKKMCAGKYQVFGSRIATERASKRKPVKK